MDALEQALDGIAEVPGPWLLHGLSGVAWTAAHLTDLVDIDEETFETLDGLVGRAPGGRALDPEWEYVLGLTGLGVYALERPAPPGDAILARVVSHLASLAERTDEAITWRSPITLLLTEQLRADNPDGYYNAGLAHGVSASSSSWPRRRRAGCPKPASSCPARSPGCRGHDSGDSRRRFPLMIARGLSHGHQRDGWCYGDQAAAVALVRAGQVLRRADLDRARRLGRARGRPA